MRVRLPIVAIVLLAVGAVTRTMSVLDRLPERMASHFGASGMPNAFMSREQFFSFFAAIGGGTVLVFLLIPGLVRRVPASMVNIPNRDYWLVPERLPAVHAKLRNWGEWFAAALTAFLVAVLELVLRANLDRQPLRNDLFIALLGVFLAGQALSIVLLVLAFRVPSRARASVQE